MRGLSGLWTDVEEDLCGKVAVAVKGEPPQNVDKSKLENGELRETNLID
jgi:hypothetical protein